MLQHRAVAGVDACHSSTCCAEIKVSTCPHQYPSYMHSSCLSPTEYTCSHDITCLKAKEAFVRCPMPDGESILISITPSSMPTPCSMNQQRADPVDPEFSGGGSSHTRCI